MIHDIPPFDPFRFWKRNSRGEDVAKAIRIKKKGEEKERGRRKKGKVAKRERERERGVTIVSL